MRTARRWAALWIALLIASWVAIFFWPIATLQAINLQDDVFTSDLLNDRLPARAFIGRTVARGEWATWMPGIYTGFPALAQVEVGSLYPSNLLLFAHLPPYTAIAIAQLLPLFIVGASTALLAVEFRLAHSAAIVAGGSMALSGFFVCHFRQLNMLDAACWLPLILLFTDRIARGRLGAALPLAVVWSLSLFAGHPQISYYTALVLAAFFVARCRQIDRSDHGGIMPWLARFPVDRRPWRFAMGVVTGTAVAGVQLLPAMELASLGLRKGGIPYEMAASFAVSPESLWSFVAPYRNGDASNMTFGLSGLFWEQYGYLGIAPVLLAIVAIVAERKDPRVRLLVGIALVSTALLLGPNTPVFPFAFAVVPGMNYFRFPARFILFVDLALALLAAYGLTHLIRAVPSRMIRAAIVVVVAAFAAGDLWIHQRRQVPLVPWEEWTKPIETVDFLRREIASHEGPWRYHTLDSAYVRTQVHHRSGGWAGDLSHYVAARDLIQPSFNLLFDLESPGGYSNLVPSHYEAVWGSEKVPGLLVPSGRFHEGAWETKPYVPLLLRLFNVRYVLAAWPLRGDSYRKIGASRHGIQIYEVHDPLPRAFVVGEVRRVESDEQALAIFRASDLDPRAVALVHDPIALPADAASSSNVRVVARSAATVHARAELDHPGLLVLSEGHFPGWEAEIDGESAPIHRVNVTMRGVVLPAGGHDVTFTFRSRSIRNGSIASLVGLVGLLGLGVVGRRERRFPHHARD